MQLLELMHTLHTRAGKIFRSWGDESQDTTFELGNLWETGWCPLLQGIARLCCDARRGVRTTAFNYLSRFVSESLKLLKPHVLFLTRGDHIYLPLGIQLDFRPF